MKAFGIIVLAVVMLGVVALAGAGNYFYQVALSPKRRTVPLGEETREAIAKADIWSDSEWLKANGKSVTALSHDNLILHGYQVDGNTHKYAIVAHGYSASAVSMAGFAHAFYNRGYTVLVPDLRGHGESEGNFIGMGWPDRLDLLAWIDGIIRNDPQAQIILHGISMGGAAVMMAAGEPLPAQVKLAIEDCGYTSVMDEFTLQMKDQYGLPPFPLLNVASLWCEINAGFSFSEADAVKQVKKSQIPILFIHGEEDTFVPFWMLDALYDAATCEKDKLAVPGAGHGLSAAVDPVAYWGAIDDFLGRYVDDAG